MAQTSNIKSPGLKKTKNTLTFAQQQAGLLVTDELNKAIEECREKVKQISRECRMKNRKFRDIEFDLENDKFRCLETLFSNKGYKPSDTQRVTQIFEKPRFYTKEGVARANDIYQGSLGDCWLMSALATVSTCPGLIEKFCVERDEQVGVYGFIFFKNSTWVSVIIDDLLYTSTPKYEELKYEEQQLYHFDKDAYVRSARKGGKQLYFAKSGDDGETWVPLLEKAYAKLHGSYASISGGEDCEAVEDMTGGVSSFIPTKDILDTDKFWEEELKRANIDRLFGCAFDSLSQERNSMPNQPLVQGLYGAHAYSVLRAVECKGKRFVVVRNPWGKTEWNGPWSDGSKEWTGEWLEILPELGHVFGDDGEFVMEYKDFLNAWQDINRTILFDDSWVMSSQWLHIPMKPLPSPWSFGDVSFTFSLSGPSLAVIVLSKLDERYFEGVSGRSCWSLDFVLVKEGDKQPLAVSNHARFYSRSVNLEIELEAGNYIVYVRIDRKIFSRVVYNIQDTQLRDLSRLLSEKAKSQSIASNLKKGFQEIFTPTSVSDLITKDYAQYEKKVKEREEREKAEKEEKERAEREKEGAEKEKDKAETDYESSYASAEDDSDADEVTTTTTTVVVTKKSKKKKPAAQVNGSGISGHASSQRKEAIPGADEYSVRAPKGDDDPDAPGPEPIPSPGPLPIPGPDNYPLPPVVMNPPPQILVDAEIQTNEPDYTGFDFFAQDDHNLYLGLKVYTSKEVSVNVDARLRAELDAKKVEQQQQVMQVQAGEGGWGAAVVDEVV